MIRTAAETLEIAPTLAHYEKVTCMSFWATHSGNRARHEVRPVIDPLISTLSST